MSGPKILIEAEQPPVSLSATSSRTGSRIVKGAGALSLAAIVNIVGQIVFVPFALSIWGAEAYGEWLVLTGLITFLSFTDLGIQSFVTNCMCSSYVRNERETLQRQLHSALKLQIPLSIVVYAAISIVFILLPVASLLGLQTVSSTALLITVLMLAGELLLGVPMGVVGGVYRATGYLPRGAVIVAARQFALFAVTLALLFVSANFAIIAAGRFLVSGLIVAVILMDLSRLHPWLDICPRSGNWGEGLRMVLPGLFFLAVPVLQYTSIQGLITLLQRSHAGTDVSWFSTHRTIVNFAIMVSGLLTMAVTPELTALHSLQKWDSLSRLYRGLERMNLWLVAGALGAMLPFLPIIYPRWTAGRLNLDWPLLALLIVRTLVWAWWNSGLILLFAISRVRPVAVALAISTVLTLGSALLLIPPWGAYGAAMAWLIGDLFSAAWLIRLSASREISRSFRSDLMAMCRAMSPVCFSFLVGLLFWYPFSSMVYHLALAFPATLVLAAVLLWRSSDPAEKEILYRLRAALRL